MNIPKPKLSNFQQWIEKRKSEGCEIYTKDGKTYIWVDGDEVHIPKHTVEVLKKLGVIR
jgi:hypothetical protein